MNFRPPTSRFYRRVAHSLLLTLSLQFHVNAADIANSPLATQAAASVRANMMFIMDDSGSMAWDFVPDSAAFYTNLCFGYSGTNRIFYDPTLTYLPPLRVDGTAFPNASFISAFTDGYAQSGTTTDLGTVANLSTRATKIDATGVNKKYYYATYKTGVTPSTPVCFGTAPNGYDWTKWDVVTTLTVAQQTNYANWYSYYRTRMLSMRGAVGRVLGAIDGSRFRIGYSAINNFGYATDSGFLPIGDFNQGTQKADFYGKLYAAPASNATPLRPALEKIGKYYANRQLDGRALPLGVADPVQYSCQRNYAILTTDGYWNHGSEPDGYSPKQLDGSTAIGNPDGTVTATVRPMLDDGKQVGANWVTGGGGVPNTLADIAMYFYNTDLRTGTAGSAVCTGSVAGQDVCENNVIPVGADTATHQHMTTFSLGLGVAGQLVYRTDYETATSGDFFAIRNGTKAWPDPRVTDTQSFSLATRADDLWHAAVNGRGRYYSAANPADLVTGLTDALDAISSTTGTGAAAATSSLRPVAGDNFVFLGQYTTVLWEGNIKALTMDPTTGAVSTVSRWEAKDRLKLQTATASDSRTIYFRNSAVPTTKLSPFTYANINAAGKGALFTNLCLTGSYKLSQCASLPSDAARTAASNGDNVVNWLRGQSGKEDIVSNPSVSDRLFRGRVNTPLGDVVGAAPAYVKKPPFRYTDAGYSTFAAANGGRTAVVYAAANDGMLHAFNATTGDEMWAYVPTVVMPDLWRLADNNYSNNHRFFVDGSPVVGDVHDGTSWRTILVGGLGAGGRSYYALDVTDPASPKSLWEYSSTDDLDLGLSFGNPVITKNKAGTWVVAFTSGYNNTSPGSGDGYLFVLNAVTGVPIDKIRTNVGTATAPSNLSKIDAWLETETDNTASRIYGGDMLGNMWRFDFDNNFAPAGKEAMLLGRALTPAGASQPITTKPLLAKAGNPATVPTVMFASGRYLGSSDIADTTLQSLYVIKDSLTATGLGILRNNVNMVQQTMVARGSTRGATIQPVDWNRDNGWYMDLSLSPGERASIDMLQARDLLVLTTNVPAPTACNPGGTSWTYFLNITTGSIDKAVMAEAMTAGQTIFEKTGGGLGILITSVTGKQKVEDQPLGSGTSSSTPRRTSWRELVR